MPATRYKIHSKGAAVGIGVTGSIYVFVSGIGKSNGFPYLIANELICSNLSKAILLPSPPGFIIENEGVPNFVSLDFNLTGESLPPADCSLITTEQPALACGIILFDIWLLNSDRHSGNIAYYEEKKQVQIFDHSHALFGSGTTNIEEYLTPRVNEPNIGGHCLLPHLTALDGMQEWFNRINAVPEFFINEVVQSATTVGLPQEEVHFVSDYLLNRRSKLLDLIKNHRNIFTQVPGQEWDKLN